MSPTMMALVSAGALLGFLVLAMIVGIAQKMDRTHGGFTPSTKGLRGLRGARQMLAAFQSGDVAQANEAARRAAKSTGVGAAIAIAAALATAGAGVLAGMSKDKSPAVSSEITAGRLHGTLLASEKPRRMALIVPGSGPTDRDGNNPMGVKGASYRLLAEGLAAKGIGSVRIDKRGMFASAEAGDGNKVSVEAYVEDIHAWIDAIKTQTKVKCVWLVGHSEGSLMVSAAAQGRKDVCGLVLLAGPGRRLGDILRQQLRDNPANAPLLDEALRAIAELEAGRHVDTANMHPALLGLFREEVQDFLISEMAVDPVDLVRKAGKKTLVLQGARDLQVSVEDAKLLDMAPRTKLEVMQGVNHMLKIAPADRAGNMATYADPNLPLAPKLVDRVARFMKDDD